MADETFQERMAKTQKKLQTDANTKQAKSLLNEIELDIAENTFALLESPHFKHYRKFEGLLMADQLRKPYDRRSPIFNEKNQITGYSKSYSEDMSYNEGFKDGMAHTAKMINSIWQKYLVYLEEKRKVKNEDAENKG